MDRQKDGTLREPGRNVIVEPSPRGGWAVMRQGNKRPSRVKSTKDEAIKIGMIYAKEERTQLIVREPDVPEAGLREPNER